MQVVYYLLQMSYCILFYIIGTEVVCELETTSTTTTVTLQWKPPTKLSKGVTAYKVEYSENKPSSLKKSNEVSIEETSFTMTELLPGTEYQINVRTVTANGTGTPAVIIATTSKLLASIHIYTLPV